MTTELATIRGLMQRRLFQGILALGVLLTACTSPSRSLAPTPNLYIAGTNYQADQVPAVYRTVQPQILYVTNRSQELRDDGSAKYVSSRSDSIGYGSANVSFPGVDNWQELLDRTQMESRQRLGSLDMLGYKDEIRFSKTPLALDRRKGEVVFQDAAAREFDLYSDRFREALAARIRESGTGHILVYVHGVRNDFEESVLTLANIWHYSGRQSVPIAFSWPAGNPGLLSYFRDRESGDFSVFHFKIFMDLLASIPEVEDIDIVAHSRGTDVVVSGLRELTIRERAKGERPKIALKTGTLILAAPDFDVGTVRQRLMGERFSESFEQVSVYVNPGDRALKLSSYLTDETRFGSLDATDFAPGELAALRKVGLIHFIRVEGASGLGHSYFRDNPSAMSDIALTLRTRAFPGGTLRPLELDQDNLWTLHPNYPLDRLPDLDLLRPGEDR